MKKSAINYLNKNLKSYCHDVSGTWAICNCVAMLLPEGYIEDKAVKETAPDFMKKLFNYDFTSYTDLKDGSFVLPDLKTAKTIYVTCYTEDDFRYQKYRYNNQLIRLFDYNDVNFMINLSTGMLYAMNEADNIIGVILPLVIKKEGEKE